ALLRAAFQYPFLHAGKAAVYALIDQSNDECLRLVRRLGYREIAEVLNISISSVSTFLGRGIRRISEEMYER
ncbi:MAG: hypothetical protein ACO394_04115, partial [Blastocatellia bacterium]